MADLGRNDGDLGGEGVRPSVSGRVDDAPEAATGGGAETKSASADRSSDFALSPAVVRVLFADAPEIHADPDPLPWNPLLDLSVEMCAKQAQAALVDAPLNAEALKILRARDDATTQYAFSIPTGSVIRALAQQCPRIVEIGAGTGYWAKLLSDAGADVVALDNILPGNSNGYMHGQIVGQWFPVQLGDETSLADHIDRSLLLMWPPMDPMAEVVLDYWRSPVGSHLIYVGEHEGGACARDEFFEALAAQFTEIAEYEIPTWRHMNDAVWVYQRHSLPKRRRR